MAKAKNALVLKGAVAQDEAPQAPPPDAAKIMYDALVEIAHSDAFFSGEKRLVNIARRAIQKVTNVK
jgi:hypothetical protein